MQKNFFIFFYLHISPERSMEREREKKKRVPCIGKTLI